MNAISKPGYFKVIADRQSYLNIVYLLMALPLGTFYFVFLVTGLSLGFGLFITLAGIPLLLLVLACSGLMCKIERFFAIKLLHFDVQTPAKPDFRSGLWPRVKSLLSDRASWKGIVYLFLKFPIGIFVFTLTITLLAISIAFIFAPVFMWTSDPLVWHGLTLDPYPMAWIMPAIGIPLGFVSLHILNNTATGLGYLTKAMLGKE